MDSTKKKKKRGKDKPCVRDGSEVTQSDNEVSIKPTKIIHVEGSTAGSLMKHAGDKLFMVYI